MRIRKKNWAQKELERSDIYIADPVCIADKRDIFSDANNLAIDMGCGKGVFLSEMALKEPGTNFIGIDVKRDMLAVAHRNITENFRKAGKIPHNIKLIPYDARWINGLFAETFKADALFINFPNPWPRERHKKRRLTYPGLLRQYREFLCETADIIFRTDDRDLFFDTAGYLEQTGFEIVYSTADYYADVALENRYPPGEHERYFSEKGQPVYYIQAKQRGMSFPFVEQY